MKRGMLYQTRQCPIESARWEGTGNHTHQHTLPLLETSKHAPKSPRAASFGRQGRLDPVVRHYSAKHGMSLVYVLADDWLLGFELNACEVAGKL